MLPHGAVRKPLKPLERVVGLNLKTLGGNVVENMTHLAYCLYAHKDQLEIEIPEEITCSLHLKTFHGTRLESYSCSLDQLMTKSIWRYILSRKN